MAEWSNAVVLKTIVRQRTGGSNPSLSAYARRSSSLRRRAFLFYLILIFKRHYLLRATFATTVALENNMLLEVVSKTLGYSTIKMAERYAITTEALISKNMEKSANLFKFHTNKGR